MIREISLRPSGPLLFGLAVVLGLVGCSPLAALNALVPDRGYTAVTDIPYGDHPRQMLDAYRPEFLSEPAPVMVFFPGGRWQAGDRAEYRFAAEALTSRGWVAVVADVRLFPEVRFPAFVEDGARVVRWARDHARRLGGDPERVWVMGHSSGAHVAAMLATDARYLNGVGMDPDALAGMVGLAGPYDFLPFEDADVRALMGPPDRWPETQPVNFVDGDEPPMLLLHGGRDRTVNPRNARRLEARVREAGGDATAVVYRRPGHVRIVLALAAPLRELAPVLDEISAFEAAR